CTAACLRSRYIIWFYCSGQWLIGSAFSCPRRCQDPVAGNFVRPRPDALARKARARVYIAPDIVTNSVGSSGTKWMVDAAALRKCARLASFEDLREQLGTFDIESVRRFLAQSHL